MKMQTVIFIILISFLSSCEKDNDGRNYFRDLQGTWNNTVSDDDALVFQSETLLQRKNLQADAIIHHYSIIIESEEMVVKYTGKDKIELANSRHKYSLNETKDTLVIEALSEYYPYYAGNVFYKSNNESK